MQRNRQKTRHPSPLLHVTIWLMKMKGIDWSESTLEKRVLKGYVLCNHFAGDTTSKCTVPPERASNARLSARLRALSAICIREFCRGKGGFTSSAARGDRVKTKCFSVQGTLKKAPLSAHTQTQNHYSQFF